MLNKNYNSVREPLILPEYGRHVFNLIKSLCKIENRDERNIASRKVIDIMGNMNPSLRDSQLFKHKLWDHLFVMSNFELDIDSPYPIPTRENLQFRPKKLEYPKKRFTHKQYGNNIRKVLNKLKGMENKEQVKVIAADVARFMKYKSYEYNQEYPCNDVIVNDIKNFTNGEIVLDESVLKSTKIDYGSKKAVQQRAEASSTNSSQNNPRKTSNFQSNRRTQSSSKNNYSQNKPFSKTQRSGSGQNSRVQPQSNVRRNNNKNNNK